MSYSNAICSAGLAMDVQRKFAAGVQEPSGHILEAIYSEFKHGKKLALYCMLALLVRQTASCNLGEKE